MNKFFFFVSTFLFAFSAFNSAESNGQSAQSSPNSMENFNRQIGTYFVRKIVMQKLIGGAICNECKKVVAELYSELGNPQQEKNIEAIIGNNVCPKTGAYKQICENFVVEEMKTAMARSEAFCIELKICSKLPPALKMRAYPKLTVDKSRHPHNANAFTLGGMDEADDEEMMS